jgi:hypothetical protein
LPNNRLGLAQWLTDPKHPLTSRVVINRLWAQVFGAGLVASSENLGLQGDLPTHPELLDTLAVDFVRSDWNTKAMLRRMVLSATFRQASTPTPEGREKDPSNRYLARGPILRLTAEMVRDQALLALLRQVRGRQLTEGDTGSGALQSGVRFTCYLGGQPGGEQNANVAKMGSNGWSVGGLRR